MRVSQASVAQHPSQPASTEFATEKMHAAQHRRFRVPLSSVSLFLAKLSFSLAVSRSHVIWHATQHCE